MLQEAIDKYNSICTGYLRIEDVFKELEKSPEHRALLEGALWVVHRNLVLLREENARGIYKNENNIYTLFDGLTSLCRFIELRMRKYETGIPPKTTLGSLLQDYIFKSETWFEPEVADKNTKPQNSIDFDKLVEHIIKNEKSPSRSILLLWVIRNY